MTLGHHIPVLAEAFVAALAPQDDDLIVDCTFGAGGHTQRLLAAANCQVIAFDRDPTAILGGAGLVHAMGARLQLVQGRFGDVQELLTARHITQIDALGADIGVSSMHLDQPERGFSFQNDGPLDMRMGDAGATAADLVNQLDEAALADLFFDFGEERQARRIARAIVAERAQRPILRTAELATLITRTIGHRPGAVHPATRCFQALRIAVNDELEELRQLLQAAERLLRAGGRLAIISFHSLEDRIVKQFLRLRSGQVPRASRHQPASGASLAATFTHVSAVVRASETEITHNPRARSAILRAATRTAAPAWS